MTKVVQLSDIAYQRLKMAKRADESFTDLILRRFPRNDLRELQGLGDSNVKWWKKWRGRIDSLDTPGRSR